MDKPTVHYDYVEHVFVGCSALLHGVTDHPNHLPGHDVSNDPRKVLWTSPVEAYDPDTGRLETRNTIYMPKEGKSE